MNQLEQLKKHTVIVADTGEFEEIKKYLPTDATTNPSLIFAAASNPQYAALIQDAVSFAKKHHTDKKKQLELAMDKVFVNFGIEILKIVPGRVSTEVDARLSFDTDASIKKARSLIKLYEDSGINKKRVLIKLASTWQSILAARELEKEGIHCNMTLMFSLAQAIACADAKATLISPFVGRILDWYKKAEGKDSYPPKQDPGVISVTEIYNYYKHYDIKTQIMGASFRNKEEVLELSGCDLLTISPKLLGELQASDAPAPVTLNTSSAKHMSILKQTIDENTFYWDLCQNPMASEKLNEGIRNFAKDIFKLESVLAAMC